MSSSNAEECLYNHKLPKTTYQIMMGGRTSWQPFHVSLVV